MSRSHKIHLITLISGILFLSQAMKSSFAEVATTDSNLIATSHTAITFDETKTISWKPASKILASKEIEMIAAEDNKETTKSPEGPVVKDKTSESNKDEKKPAEAKTDDNLTKGILPADNPPVVDFKAPSYTQYPPAEYTGYPAQTSDTAKPEQKLQVKEPLYPAWQKQDEASTAITLTSEPVIYDMEKALNLSLTQNRSILEELEDNIVYKYKAKVQATGLLPMFNVQNDYTFNSNTYLPNIGYTYTYPRNINSLYVYFSQPISTLYQNALLYKVSKREYEISLLQTQYQKNSVLDTVSANYFNILKQQKIIDYNIANIKALEEFYRVAVSNYKQGNALARDYMKIQYQIDDAKHQLLVQQDQLQIYFLQLKNLMNVDLNRPIQVVEDYFIEDLSKKPFDDLLNIAYQNRPEILQLEKYIQVAKLNKKVRIADFIPTVQLNSGYYNTYGPQSPPPNNYVIGVSATYPLWDWNKRLYQIREEAAKVRKEELRLVDQKNQVYIDIKTQLNTVQENLDLIAAAKSNVETSTESLRITTNRFKVGLALVLDLLDDQKNLLDAQEQLVSAEYGYQQSLVDLKKILGIINK